MAVALLNGSAGITVGRRHRTILSTLKMFHDVQLSAWLIPYIGVGGGVNYGNKETGVFAGAGGIPRFTQLGGHATDAAFLAEVGLSIQVNASWSVVPSYRFEKVFPPATAFPNNANLYKLGLRYTM